MHISLKNCISGIQIQSFSWNNPQAQIDSIIDRSDNVINICECKFSLDTFTIIKSYTDNLRSKISVFKEVSGTKKAIHLRMISTYGVTDNQYKDMLVRNEITIYDLFV